MAKRAALPSKQSKSLFIRTALKRHKKNSLSQAGSSVVMRGGIRL